MSFVTLEISTLDEISKIFTEIKRVLKSNELFICIHSAETFFELQNRWISYFKDYPENNAPGSRQQLRIKILPIDLELLDFYWRNINICKCATNANLSLLEIHYPLGKDSDNIPWESEWNTSPYALFVFKK